MKFDSETTKQYRIYAFDLERYIKIFLIIFFKNVQKGEIDLKLSNFISNKLMIRNFKRRLKKISLRSSSIKYKINTIKNTPSDFQKSTNQIMSLSRSKKSEIIRKKENILSEKDAAQKSSITIENQNRAIIKIELQNRSSSLNSINQIRETQLSSQRFIENSIFISFKSSLKPSFYISIS